MKRELCGAAELLAEEKITVPAEKMKESNNEEATEAASRGAFWRPMMLPASLSASIGEAVLPSTLEMPTVVSTIGDEDAPLDTSMHTSAGICSVLSRSFFFFEDSLFGASATSHSYLPPPIARWRTSLPLHQASSVPL